MHTEYDIKAELSPAGRSGCGLTMDSVVLMINSSTSVSSF